MATELQYRQRYPDSKVHGANMGPTWVLPAPDGPHFVPTNLAIRILVHVKCWLASAFLCSLRSICKIKIIILLRTSHPIKRWFILTWEGTGEVNTLRPRQIGRQFADDTFKRIFLNENIRILIDISLKFVPKCPINNISTLVQIIGDTPLSEPMMVTIPTHICVTRTQWVKNTSAMRYPWSESQ